MYLTEVKIKLKNKGYKSLYKKWSFEIKNIKKYLLTENRTRFFLESSKKNWLVFISKVGTFPFKL